MHFAALHCLVVLKLANKTSKIMPIQRVPGTQIAQKKNRHHCLRKRGAEKTAALWMAKGLGLHSARQRWGRKYASTSAR